jgi:hypothetical protein
MPLRRPRLKFARQHITEQVHTQASSLFEHSPEDIPKKISDSHAIYRKDVVDCPG